MSVVSRTNRWTSRLVIALQLVTWSTVSIILLQKGVSSLQRRKLEASHVTEANPSIDGLSAESSTVSSAKASENKTRQSVDEIAKLIIRFNSELARRNNRSGLNIIKNELGDEFKFVSEGRRPVSLPNSLEISTTDQDTLSSSLMGNRLLDERDPDGKSISSRILRIHDKIISHEISRNRAEENIASSEKSISQSISKEERNRHQKKEDNDFAENISPSTLSSTREKLDDQVPTLDSLWRTKEDARFSHRVSSSGAAMAVVMVVIGTIMLLLGPAVIVLRLLDERRARKLQNELSDDTAWQEDLPPAYEQVVLMDEEAPRYSTLVFSGLVSDDVHLSSSSSTLAPSPSPSPSRSPSSSPSPSPSPSSPFSSAYGSSLDISEIKIHSHR
ncbi:hypothetical protein EAI_05421 [Harpegnathos saltator]|uniref:Uncharacterized protein n=1 Tax=Harpegnathos saltator TaxID=610380 RepID=E2BRN8_HARSA|nr:hypothetical protein EAI_05421 [Harpegnathos saltator]